MCPAIRHTSLCVRTGEGDMMSDKCPLGLTFEQCQEISKRDCENAAKQERGRVLYELEDYRKKHSAVYGEAMTFRDEAEYIKHLRGVP